MICPYIVHQMIILQAGHDDDTDTQIDIASIHTDAMSKRSVCRMARRPV